MDVTRVIDTCLTHAIADEYGSRRAKQLRAELQKELEELDKYTRKNGFFSEMIRAHDGSEDSAV